MNQAPKRRCRAKQSDKLKIAQIDKDKMKETYLKPFRTIGCREKFNETYRAD